MTYFAEAILTGSEIFALGIYLLSNAVAGVLIFYHSFKIIRDKIKHRPIQKRSATIIVAALLVVVIAQLLIELD